MVLVPAMNPESSSEILIPPSSGGGVISRPELRSWLSGRSEDGSTPSGGVSTGLPVTGFPGTHRRHRRDHPRYYPVYPWYPCWYYPYTHCQPRHYPQPTWYRPDTCPPPLSDDCTRLQISARWATSCFMPRYRYLRNVYGDDPEVLSSALAREEAPWCSFPARSGASAEYGRRIQLAVAVLLNADGVPVRYPPAPPTPRPRNADSVAQPWMRALLTGWT
jgi:hypothetical protein